MNYYEHHLGDWAAATGHLSWDEDMAYTRLLRAYYHTERAIPEGQQYRLAKATTPAQRKAVDAVLEEFFELRDGSWHQKRADAEIERYRDKQAKAARSANARWSKSERNAVEPSSTVQRNANASETHCDRNANALPAQCEGNAHQTPDTRHQEDQTLSSAVEPPTAIEVRLAQVTLDAIAAYNRLLAEPLGLTRVTEVGIDRKRGWVRRSLKTIREVCRAAYGSERIEPRFWEDYFTAQAADDFIAGRTGRTGIHAGWKPSFEYLTRPDVITNTYDRVAA